MSKPDEIYMGIPRKDIPWYPIINYGKCDLCGGEPQCLKFCPHEVFEVDKDAKKLVVKNPENCVVFCRSCRKVCDKDALSFLNKAEVLDIIKKKRGK